MVDKCEISTPCERCPNTHSSHLKLYYFVALRSEWHFPYNIIKIVNIDHANQFINI